MNDRRELLQDYPNRLLDMLDVLEAQRRHDLTDMEGRLLDYQHRIVAVLNDWAADFTKRTADKATLNPAEEEEYATLVILLCDVCSFVKKIREGDKR